MSCTLDQEMWIRSVRLTFGGREPHIIPVSGPRGSFLDIGTLELNGTFDERLELYDSFERVRPDRTPWP